MSNEVKRLGYSKYSKATINEDYILIDDVIFRISSINMIGTIAYKYSVGNSSDERRFNIHSNGEVYEVGGDAESIRGLYADVFEAVFPTKKKDKKYI